MNTESQAPKGGKTLLSSLILSAPGPLVTGIAAVTSRSATQLADFIRRSAELVATFFSWWVFRKTTRDTALGSAERARLESLTSLVVTCAMVFAGIAMCVVGALRLITPRASGNVLMGLIIAILGALTNTWFWLRYRRLAREEGSPVMAAQQKLYRAKAVIDLSVTLALLVVAILPGHIIAQYIDATGSIAVGIYLITTGLAKRKTP